MQDVQVLNHKLHNCYKEKIQDLLIQEKRRISCPEEWKIKEWVHGCLCVCILNTEKKGIIFSAIYLLLLLFSLRKEKSCLVSKLGLLS